MVKAVDLRKGKVVLHEGNLYIVHEAQHVAKGNKRSYMSTKLKNFKSGVMSDVRFNVDDRVETPFMEGREYEYLYNDGNNYIFMDTSNYDQIPIAEELIGEQIHFLKANTKVDCQLYEGAIVGVELPHTVELTITETPPVVKGSTATNQPKEAILETGARIRVPSFIEPGQVVRVDTRTGEYLERAKA